MYTVLLLAVTLLFLLGPVVTAAPTMEFALPAAPMDPFAHDFEALSPLCQFCAMPCFQCLCLPVAMPQAPYVAAPVLFNDLELVDAPPPDFQDTEADLAPIFAYVAADDDRQPLINEHVQYINANETTVQPETIQAHIEDIYTPGDRLKARKHNGSRRAQHRRQAPRPGGYPCPFDGCEKAFDRACELNRHQKTHLDRSERPHKCPTCTEGFLYPKDLHRHQRKHVEQPSQVTFFCRYPGCANLEGFSRRDNLLRHQRKQHAPIVAAS